MTYLHKSLKQATIQLKLQSELCVIIDDWI